MPPGRPPRRRCDQPQGPIDGSHTARPTADVTGEPEKVRPTPTGLRRIGAALHYRDFRILWTGMTISLVGDGIFLIAIAWESYSLWNAPATGLT